MASGTSVIFPSRLRERVDAYCAAHERPVAWLVRRAVQQFLDREERPTPQEPRPGVAAGGAK